MEISRIQLHHEPNEGRGYVMGMEGLLLYHNSFFVGAGTREGVCTKWTGDVWVLVIVGDTWAVASFDFPLHNNIFSIEKI